MKRPINLLRGVAISIFALGTLTGCEAALDPSLLIDPDTSGPTDNSGPKRPIPIKPKKNPTGRVERPKLVDDLINKIISPNNVMQYEHADIEEPR